jgi:hypothetical protein
MKNEQITNDKLRAQTPNPKAQVVWESQEQRLSQQRALIDELLQATAGSEDSVPSAPEIRELLEQHIPYSDSLSNAIIAMRYQACRT